MKRKNILEINNIDLIGKRFNGYDIMEFLNDKTSYNAKQAVLYKSSKNNNVIKLYEPKDYTLAYIFEEFEKNVLNVQSCLSLSTFKLLDKDEYKEADLLHFHLIHNTKLSLFSLIQMCNEKPSIISIHDPWIFTGRCVHFKDCDKYLSGCHNCENLNTVFQLRKDYANELWRLKKLVYDNIDVDFVVPSKYMYDIFKKSPLTKNKRVHLIPFGIDVNYFYTVDRKKARQKFNIKKDEIVIFTRTQKDFKGIEYLISIFEKLKVDKKITILTCAEIGLLDKIKNKYRVIDLGMIQSEKLRYAYKASDIFISTSLGESFGLMPVEAMSAEIPVIVFDNTAQKDVVCAPDAGIAVEDRNVEEFVEALEYLINNEKERLKRGKICRQKVIENYDINDYNKKMKELYDEVLSRDHHFDNSILNRKIEETKDTINLKYKLNILTKRIFPRRLNLYDELLFKINQKCDLNYKIDYGDINVQLVLYDYLNKIYPIYMNAKFRRRDGYIRLFKKTQYQLLHDKKALLESIKKKIKER